MKCPDFFQILEFVESRLQPASAKKVKSHLNSGCQRCRELSDWVSKTLKLMKSDRLTDAPEYLIRNAISFFPERNQGVFEWVKAKLHFDSWSIPQLQGVRGSETGPREVNYRTDLYQVFLKLMPQEKRGLLLGQLVPMQPENVSEGCMVELRQGNKVIASHVTSTYGEFVFDSVPKRNFELAIHTDQEPILISYTEIPS